MSGTVDAPAPCTCPPEVWLPDEFDVGYAKHVYREAHHPHEPGCPLAPAATTPLERGASVLVPAVVDGPPLHGGRDVTITVGSTSRLLVPVSSLIADSADVVEGLARALAAAHGYVWDQLTDASRGYFRFQARVAVAHFTGGAS